MHIVVVGCGKIGFHLVQGLSERKHDVVVIEKNPERCDAVANELNAIVLRGDGTEKEILEEAGISKADVFVAVTNSEEINLLSCLVVKELAHPKTIARCSRQEYKQILQKAGIDTVISPELATATRLENYIEEPDVVDIATIHRGDIEFLEFEVTENSPMIGKTVKEVEYPQKSSIVTIKEGSKYIIPDNKTVLRAGDRLIILTKKSMEDKIKKMFK